MTLTAIHNALKKYMDASLAVDGKVTQKAQYALGQLEQYAKEEEQNAKNAQMSFKTEAQHG